jgi:hypothetical protein
MRSLDTGCPKERQSFQTIGESFVALFILDLWLKQVRWFTHDPSVYNKPTDFIPERFITTETHAAELDPRTFTFGYGRRACPGRHVADNALILTIAQTLATFNIGKAVENGKIVEPEVKFQAGVVSHPEPFKASIVPRSTKHAALIRRMESEFPWEQSDAEALQKLM